MSGRHAGQSATRKRIVRIATVSAVAAVPLGVAAAGAASADTTPLPVDTSSVTGLLSPVTNLLGGGGDNGGITSAVTNALSGTPAAGVLSTVTSAASDTPVAGVLDMASGSDAQSAVADSPVAGLLGTVTGATANTPVAGVLGTVTHVLSSGNPVDGLGGVVNGLGLQGVTDTLKPVTQTVNGLLNPILGNGGLLGGLTGGLLGGLLGGNQPGDNGVTTSQPAASDTGDEVSNTALPHTGGNSDMTALLLCSGLGLAGGGVTLVARRRGGVGA
ncbi:MAG TPA: hypothetical protein VHV82_09070 [Sporichthyaceae bacterium]|nr:hypothetical protein [Sporichthyaceae bacterium]